MDLTRDTVLGALKNDREKLYERISSVFKERLYLESEARRQREEYALKIAKLKAEEDELQKLITAIDHSTDVIFDSITNYYKRRDENDGFKL